jgi:hypothetical protein
MGAGRGDVQWSRRPMGNGGSPVGECAQAAWHRPRPLVHVISSRCTVASARASDRWISWRLGVRAQPGYGGDDVARGVRRRAGTRALAPSLFRVTLFKMKFLQISKHKCTKL